MLTSEEREVILKICGEELSEEIPLIAGCSAESTRKTIENMRRAKACGADAVLIATPYYVKPTQQGLIHHFERAAEAVDIPIILYNIPSRTGTNLLPYTLEKLAEISSIVGIKECSGDLIQAQVMMERISPLRFDFSFLSGDDHLTLPIMALGGHGVVSVISNLFPKEMKELMSCLESNSFVEARKLHSALFPLFQACFIETNPAPIKAAMEFFELPAGTCRSPLVPLLPENALQLKTLLTLWSQETVLSTV